MSNANNAANNPYTRLSDPQNRANLFHEILSDLIAKRRKETPIPVEPTTTEYRGQFTTNRPHSECIEQVNYKCIWQSNRFLIMNSFALQEIADHPLYRSSPINYWAALPTAKPTFKQCHPLTKPNAEYFDGQWR